MSITTFGPEVTHTNQFGAVVATRAIKIAGKVSGFITVTKWKDRQDEVVVGGIDVRPSQDEDDDTSWRSQRTQGFAATGTATVFGEPTAEEFAATVNASYAAEDGFRWVKWSEEGAALNPDSRPAGFLDGVERAIERYDGYRQVVDGLLTGQPIKY